MVYPKVLFSPKILIKALTVYKLSTQYPSMKQDCKSQVQTSPELFAS